VNEAVRKLGFKIPELWDPTFLASLAQPVASPESRRAGTDAISPQNLSELKQHLFRIGSLSPQERGYAFERFLADLFSAFGMAPRGGYRLRGEQIDGSFEDERDYYLVEAKWQAQKIGAAELRSFLGRSNPRLTGRVVATSATADSRPTACMRSDKGGRPA